MHLRFRHGMLRILPVLAVVAAACTEPQPESDAGPWPYRLTPRGVRVNGTSRVLVLPAMFADGAAPPITRAAIIDRYFGGSDGGAVAATYGLASGGKFRLRAEVGEWFRTSVKYSELGLKGVVAQSRSGDYVVEAIAAADGYIDFGRFDNDGPDGFPNSGDDDGFVDGGVVVMNSDINAICGGAVPGKGVHPHANTIWRDAAGKPFPTADDAAKGGKIVVGGYIQMGVKGCDPAQVGSNVLAHELGHLFLGLPDLYHAVGGTGQSWETRRWMVGCWDLMSSGSGWGCGSGPPPLDPRLSTLGAWDRVTVGWAEPIVVDLARDSVYTLRAPAAGGDILKLTVSASEYFLVEYREPAANDALLPGSGVLIYHVVETRKFYPALTEPRDYRVSLVEADDDGALIRTQLEGGNRGIANDAFGAGNVFAPGAHSRAVTSTGAPIPFSITEIAINGSAHRATIRIRPV